jgi:hypothetical protein
MPKEKSVFKNHSLTAAFSLDIRNNVLYKRQAREAVNYYGARLVLLKCRKLVTIQEFMPLWCDRRGIFYGTFFRM